MFTRVEVRNFKSLRDVSVPLSNFHVLVGANGSGKSSFLDVFAFMGDLLNGGVAGGTMKNEALANSTRFDMRFPSTGTTRPILHLYLSENCFIFDSGKGPRVASFGALVRKIDRNPQTTRIFWSLHQLYHAQRHTKHDAGQPNCRTYDDRQYSEVVARKGAKS
jgi:ABC-type molybdenum transport system ATPase subunit/photorepair protein PhrA